MVSLVTGIDKILFQEEIDIKLNSVLIKKSIEIYAKFFVDLRIPELKTSYLSQNWMSYHSFSRSKKPKDKFKTIESQSLIKFLMESILSEQWLYMEKDQENEAKMSLRGLKRISNLNMS